MEEKFGSKNLLWMDLTTELAEKSLANFLLWLATQMPACIRDQRDGGMAWSKHVQCK